jgi:magnesium-transporting ATPase (P-type)
MGRPARGSDDEVERNGSALWRCLRRARLDRCFEKPVQGPAKGAAVKSISLRAPQTVSFASEQRAAGAAARRNNSVVTSKYTVWTFVPLSASYQFRRFVNAFYLVIVVLLVIGNAYPNLFLAPWQATGTATYLVILVVAGMLVEGLDDRAKHIGDREENNRAVERLDWASGALIKSKWGELIPGDVVVVNDRESFPADLVLLYGAANEERNQCYIETAGIDGETNLKIKDVPAALNKLILERVGATLADPATPRFGHAERAAVAAELAGLARGTYEYEQPNVFLQFNGSFAPAKQGLAKVPLEFKNLVLRGSSLRNTRFVMGLVAYAGHETKLAMSRKPSPTKFSRIDQLINSAMFALLAVYLCLVVLAVGLLYLTPSTGNFWYFAFTETTTAYKLPGVVAFFFTFAILFSSFIPIPMVLLNEILNKYFQDRVNDDLSMYHAETDTPARCRTASLTAEVGQLTHFFSDKTGTLTRNEMKLVGLWVQGRMYGFKPAPVGVAGSASASASGVGAAAAPAAAAAASDRAHLALKGGPRRLSEEDQEDSEDSDQQDPEREGGRPAAASSWHDDDQASEPGGGESVVDVPQTDIFRDVLALLGADKNGGKASPAAAAKERRKALDLIVFLAVCHTVILDRDEETDTVTFNAESPDEEAFVKGAGVLGVQLVAASNGEVTITVPGGAAVTYKVLAVNPFSSARKRMSLVVQRENGTLAVMMKGADNKMLERLASGQDREVDRLNGDLSAYAWGGLRTLVMGQRELSEREFLQWQESFQAAQVAPSAEREDALARAAERLEHGMKLVGATAIEDQLQLGVPAAIQTLRDAGIQVWVLTGDKMETAINIGLSSRLLDPDMFQLKLVSVDTAELEKQLDGCFAVLRAAKGAAADKARQQRKQQEPSKPGVTVPGITTEMVAFSETGGAPGADLEGGGAAVGSSFAPGAARGGRDEGAAAGPDEPPELEGVTSEFIALVVSGEALEMILHSQKGSKELELKFLHVARACKVVLACRVSPKQKALIVEMVRFAPDNGRLRRQPITLAIGDGANDVPMIQSAHVGVGISGHEGRQAVNASDFSIAQFRFVTRLCIVHGRWNYRRQAVLILFLIYSWMLYVGVLYIFQPYCLWSGQQVYFFYLYTFFAAPLFNFAIISVGWYNTDLRDRFALAHPWVYEVGMQNKDLGLSQVLWTIAKGVFHILLVWLFVFRSSAISTSQEVFGSTTFTTVFFIIYFMQLLDGDYFTSISFLCFVLILACFLAGMALVTDPAFIYSKEANAGSTWAQVFLALLASIVVSALIQHIYREWFPTSLQLLMEQDRGYFEGGSHSARQDALRVIRDSARVAAQPFPIGLNMLRAAIKKTGKGRAASGEARSGETRSDETRSASSSESRILQKVKVAEPAYDFVDHAQGGAQRAEADRRPRVSSASSSRMRLAAFTVASDRGIKARDESESI